MKSCTFIGNPHEKELTFSADFTRGALKTLRKKKQIIKKMLTRFVCNMFKSQVQFCNGSSITKFNNIYIFCVYLNAFPSGYSDSDIFSSIF